MQSNNSKNYIGETDGGKFFITRRKDKLSI